ncbi:MAG: hypothetical protein FWG03_03930 [Clostridiales bacterium]|nr:hypothetical protein [Clostridiales bacterium]
MIQGLPFALALSQSLALSLGLTIAFESGFFVLVWILARQFRSTAGQPFITQEPHKDTAGQPFITQEPHEDTAGQPFITQKPHRGSPSLWHGKDLLLVVLVNIITNPVVVLLFWLAKAYTGWNTIAVLIPLELFAVLLEGCYYKIYGKGFARPYLFSAAANMFSFWMGMLIQAI